nr:MAG TPA: hypothetical protein [Caudoviricetes sp.]
MEISPSDFASCAIRLYGRAKEVSKWQKKKKSRLSRIWIGSTRWKSTRMPK